MDKVDRAELPFSSPITKIQRGFEIDQQEQQNG